MELSISTIKRAWKIIIYTVLSVAPVMSLTVLDTGHSYQAAVITITLVVIGVFAAYRGLSTVKLIYAKVLFGIPAALNTFVLLFLIAVSFDLIIN